MMTKTKTIKARTLMSLRAKVDDARSEGWFPRGDAWRVNGEYCQLMEYVRGPKGERGSD